MQALCFCWITKDKHPTHALEEVKKWKLFLVHVKGFENTEKTEPEFCLQTPTEAASYLFTTSRCWEDLKNNCNDQ